jgi:hypothetical protein
MSNASRSYGFSYPFEGKRFALDVSANGPDQAKARVAAMANATFVSELSLVHNQGCELWRGLTRLPETDAHWLRAPLLAPFQKAFRLALNALRFGFACKAVDK